MVQANKILQLAIIFLIASIIVSPNLQAQQPGKRKNILFNQLNSDQGLSDNYVWSICVDKTGNLWIATGDGLNIFNGKKITSFFKQEHPQLRSDNHREIICDDQNRIWTISVDGFVTVIDENRRFHRVSFQLNQKTVFVRWIVHTKSQGVIFLTKEGAYAFKKDENILSLDSLTVSSFSKFEIAGLDSIEQKGYLQVDRYDDDSYILTKQNGFYKVDFREKTIGKLHAVPGLDMHGNWKPQQVLATDFKTSKLVSVDLATDEISYPLQGIND